MKRGCILLGLTAAFCGVQAFAVEIDPSSRAKAIASAAPASAPPAATSRVQLPDLQGGVDVDGRTFSGACGAARSDLCYDHREGRLVVRSTRNWMPEINGLRAEHISLRKDRVNFRYSFK